MLNRGNAQNHSDIETRKAMRGRIALQKHSVRNMEALFLVFAQLWECARVLAPLLLAWLEPATNSVQCAVETHFQRLLGGNLNSWGDAAS